MIITKLGHSCVLVDDGYVVLFDPGVWADRGLIDTVEHVDEIVYTHEHPDHFSVEILQALSKKFPNAQIICNNEITTQIADAGITLSCSESSDCVRPFTSSHEQLPIPGVQAPAQSGYHYKNLFTHPGDSQSFSETKTVLAMPFIAPWGKTGDSLDKVLQLKPHYVLPVHDWHYTDEAKAWLQGILETVLVPAGIMVLPNKNGHTIEVK